MTDDLPRPAGLSSDAQRGPIRPGAFVVVHLMGPSEKYWGRLESIAAFGVTLRCLNVASFEDWARSIAADEAPDLGLATIFFPMGRVERLFLDERVGEVESMREAFERITGRDLESYLGEIEAARSAPPPAQN